jgi:hypothetical protein
MMICVGLHEIIDVAVPFKLTEFWPESALNPVP